MYRWNSINLNQNQHCGKLCYIEANPSSLFAPGYEMSQGLEIQEFPKKGSTFWPN